MATKAEAIGRLADALAGSDIDLGDETVSGSIIKLAELIEDGSISVGGSQVTVVETSLTGSLAEGAFVINNASGVCDALDAVREDPVKAFSYGILFSAGEQYDSLQPLTYFMDASRSLDYGAGDGSASVMFTGFTEDDVATYLFSFGGMELTFTREDIAEDGTATLEVS